MKFAVRRADTTNYAIYRKRYLHICKCADVTDAEVISRLGIGNVDTVIVCMASNLEASVMAITLCMPVLPFSFQ